MLALLNCKIVQEEFKYTLIGMKSAQVKINLNTMNYIKDY